MKESVFFIGAGFSKAICDFYPDLSNLSEISMNYMENDTTDPLSSHFINNVPEDYRCNLELLLTYCHIKQMFRYLWMMLYIKILQKRLQTNFILCQINSKIFL